MNTFRVTVGSLAGVVLAVGVAGVASLVSARNEQDRPATQANAAPDRPAPNANNNPMDPVVSQEASRRSELHNRIAEEQASAAASLGKDSAAYVAPPVVTEVRSSKGDDALTRAIFEDKPEEPKPAKKAPEPKPEPAKVVEKEKPKQPAYMNLYDQYRDRLRIKMQDNTPDPTVIGVRVKQQQQSSLLGDIWNFVSSSIVGSAYAADPLSSADGSTEYGANDYPSRPHFYVIGTNQRYSAPDMNQRSAARPALVGIDANGRGYGTQEYRDSQVRRQQSGRTVLARAGDLVYARLMYGFNSDDIRGIPIYAILTDILDSGEDGPLNGARVEGRVGYSRDNASISFNRIILADGRDIPMTGIGISADAARTGVAAKVNMHYIQNLGALFLTGLMEGAGEVMQAYIGDDNGTNINIVTGDGSNSSSSRNNDQISYEELAVGALGPVGKNLTRYIERRGDRPPTISAPAGHIFAVVMLNTLVYDPATMKGQPAYNPRTGQMSDVGSAPDVPGSSTGPIDLTGNGNIEPAPNTQAPATNGSEADDGWTVEPWRSNAGNTNRSSTNQQGQNVIVRPPAQGSRDPIAQGVN